MRFRQLVANLLLMKITIERRKMVPGRKGEATGSLVI